jgi:serine/threonine-protein kinase
VTVQIGDVIGDYKVIDTAGSGGMGAVYKIEHVITKRIEAMKILPSGLSTDPEQVQRFEREIQLQARLHHPNIVALYNALRDERSIALVMEFVEGEPLQRMLEAGPLPLKTAVEYARQVLSALAYAHEAGVIHRDVSPANIIITPDRTAKLTDFGLARTESDLRLTVTGAPVGSPWYMSPEQILGVGVIDSRTDIYALAAVLYEMLTGAKAFEGEGAFEVMRGHMETTPAPPSSRNPEVPPAVDQIVLRALAKEPEKRFQSADEFRVALENAVKTARPVVVPLPPTPRPAPAGPLLARFQGLRISRAEMLMAAAPIALVAGIGAILLHPKAVRVKAPVAAHKTAAPPQAAAPSIELTSVPAIETVATSPAPHPDTPVPAPAPAGAISVPIRATPAPPVAATPRRQPVAAKPERSFAIRVSGGEVEPASPTASGNSSAAATHSATVSLPSPPKTDATAIPEAPAVGPVPTATPAVDMPQDPAPIKPQKPGNRLVRALGRINPFHKDKKDETTDSSKPPAKKD